MRLGSTLAPYFSEAYDSVTAPVCRVAGQPPSVGRADAWTTVATGPINSSLNVAVAPSAAGRGQHRADPPAIAAVPAGEPSSFRNLYNLRAGATKSLRRHGARIHINGGAFTDITTGGNAFLTGATWGTISASFAARSPAARRGAVCRVATTAAPDVYQLGDHLPLRRRPDGTVEVRRRHRQFGYGLAGRVSTTSL